MARIALLGLFLTLAAYGQPNDRLRRLKMPIRHPDARWLSTQGDFPEACKERVYEGRRMGGLPMPFVFVPSNATWRPDPQAQIDELKAQLADQARKSWPANAEGRVP